MGILVNGVPTQILIFVKDWTKFSICHSVKQYQKSRLKSLLNMYDFYVTSCAMFLMKHFFLASVYLYFRMVFAIYMLCQADDFCLAIVFCVFLFFVCFCFLFLFLFHFIHHGTCTKVHISKLIPFARNVTTFGDCLECLFCKKQTKQSPKRFAIKARIRPLAPRKRSERCESLK